MTDGEEEVLAEVRRVAAFELELDRIVGPDDELAGDLQLDSVAALTLVVALEDAFRVRLDDADAERVRTVRDLGRLVDARRDRDRPAAAP
jgi:acyl carrier protein